MIYMQDEYPDGWCVYNETGRLYSHLEEDTAGAIIAHLNESRAEVARLREALAKYADHDNWVARPVQYSASAAQMVYDIWENGRDTHGWETAEAALANETLTA